MCAHVFMSALECLKDHVIFATLLHSAIFYAMFIKDTSLLFQLTIL